MSFVEGISAVGIDLAEEAIVLCVSGVLLLIAMLAAVPAVATTLHFLHFDALARLLRRWRTALGRGLRKP